MKTSLFLISIVLLFSSCIKQEGFTEGAFVRVYNGTNSILHVKYKNKTGLGDSIKCLSNAVAIIPVDMNSDNMNLTVVDSNVRSELRLKYALSVTKGVANLRLNLDEISAQLDTTTNPHGFFIGESSNGIRAYERLYDPLDSNSNWDFINDNFSVIWVE